MTAKRTNSPIATLAAALAATMLAGCGYAGYAPISVDNSSSGYTNNNVIRQQAIPQLPRGVSAKSLSLSPATGSSMVGQSLRLALTLQGSDGKNYTDPRLVVWSVSNPQLAVVDENGVLQPQVPGSIKVTATLDGMSASAAIEIHQAQYAWQQVMSPANHDLHAVKMISPYDAWAGGDHGTLLRFVNGGWFVEPSFHQADADIKGLGFVDSSVGWAVGARGETPYISKWENGAWHNEVVPAPDGSLNAISVLNAHDAWAVGQAGNGDALILHFDGANWKSFASPARGKLDAIQMLSNKSGWAVGKYDGLASVPMIFKFVDGQWVKKGWWVNKDASSLTSSLEVTGIKMVSETQGYAVGIKDTPLHKSRGLFLVYDPKSGGWTNGQWDSKVDNLDQVPLHAIEMISGTQGWALGEVRKPDWNLATNPRSIFGNLLANDGGVLKLDTNFFSGNLSGAFYGIDLLPQGEGFVVGSSGYILQRTFDWRNGQNANSSTYGSNGSTQAAPVTYGPGGQAVPGAQPSPLY